MTQPESISSKQPSHREDALAVLKKLRDAGHVAYFAGGCVRDLLLGKSPKDFDVATDAPPGRVQELFINTQAVGAAFGVILVRQKRSVIEVATFRVDGDYSDGRRPDSVRFTTAEEDAKRRDFTINGIFLDPLADGPHGKVIDYVGGQADLTARIVRAIGEPAARFGEDYLRMLRAVRFAARLSFAIDSATADAIRAEAGSIARVSPERIADELRLMLTAPTREDAWRHLDTLSLLPTIFRGIPGAANSGHFFSETDRENPISFRLALAIAVVSFPTGGSPLETLTQAWIGQTVKKVRTLLKLSNDERDALQAILQDAAGLVHESWSLARRMRFMATPTAGDCRTLLHVLAENGFDRERIAAIEDSLQPLESVECNPAPWVTGDALITAGLSPGPKFKKILDDVYDAQLESRVSDPSAALEFAMKLAGEKRK